MYKGMKWILDRVMALFLLLLFAPLIFVVIVLIKLDSKGPAIFKQQRSGKGEKPFTLYKFRSMVAHNDVHDLRREDEMTKVGSFLRKTSLDELPQLFNILKGDMSFIGPRPWITDYSVYFTENQKRRLEVRPGISGLAQCSGRNDISIKEKINLDIYYVDHVSLKMDLIIIFKTIKAVITKEGVMTNKTTIKSEIEELKEQWNGKIAV